VYRVLPEHDRPAPLSGRRRLLENDELHLDRVGLPAKIRQGIFHLTAGDRQTISRQAFSTRRDRSEGTAALLVAYRYGLKSVNRRLS
jgi:hypothetical protein